MLPAAFLLRRQQLSPMQQRCASPPAHAPCAWWRPWPAWNTSGTSGCRPERGRAGGSRAGVGTAWIERRACPDAKGKFAVSTTSPRSEPSQAGSRPRHASPGPTRRPPPPPPEDVEHDERHGGQVPARVHHRQQGQQAGGGHAVSHHVQHCRQQGVRVGWVPGEGRAGGGSGVSVGRAQALLLLLQRCRPVQCLAATQPALACPVFRCTPIPAIQQPAPTPARPTHPSPAWSTG